MSGTPQSSDLLLFARAMEARNAEEALAALKAGQWQVLPVLGFVDESVISQVLDLHPVQSYHLFHNPNLSPELLHYLARESFRRAMSELEGEGEKVRRTTCRYEGVLNEACAGRVLEYHSPEVRAMRARIVEVGSREPGDGWTRQMRHCSSLVGAVAHCPEVPTEVLHEMFDLFPVWLRGESDAPFLVHLVESPQADLSLWRKVIGRDPDLYVLRQLSERREARLDPEIREAMRSKARQSEVLRVALALDETDDCRSRLLALASADPEVAVRVLSAPECRVTERLGREDWAALLASPHAPLRLLAIQRSAQPGEVPSAPVAVSAVVSRAGGGR